MSEIFQKNILSENENEFYNILKNNFPNLNVFAQVALPAFIETKNYKLRNYFRHYYIDFILCNSKGNIILVIELDDNTHKKQKRIERDIKINTIFSNTNIPFLRIKSQKNYNPIFIKQKIENYINKKENLPTYKTDNNILKDDYDYEKSKNNKKNNTKDDEGNKIFVIIIIIIFAIFSFFNFFKK
ncbi:MAG: DUF2726 domain-containing protein [Bacteroidales bacterium]|jgi:very-short-patch-repair endonuclease|nr:DUF2726 domain-containing protein [Bacteroidales bacterium]